MVPYDSKHVILIMSGEPSIVTFEQVADITKIVNKDWADECMARLRSGETVHCAPKNDKGHVVISFTKTV